MKIRYQLLILFWFLIHFSFAQNHQHKRKSDHTITVKTEFKPSCKTLSTVEEMINREEFVIIPNPVKGDYFEVKIPSRYTKLEAKVFLLSGQLVRKVKLSTSNPNVFVGDLSSGLYVVKLITEEETFNFKIVKE